MEIYGRVENMDKMIERMSLSEREELAKNGLTGSQYFPGAPIFLSKEEKESLLEYLNEFVTWNEQWTMLMEAAHYGDKNVVNALIKIGVDVNHKDFWGRAALSYAKEVNNEEIIKILVEAGAKDEEVQE